MNTYYVYILHCSDGSYYTGITNSVERRIEEHGATQDPHAYVHSRRPFTLVYKAEFREVTEAIAWETKVKGWSRKKKEALIAKEYEKLPRLAGNQYLKRITCVTKKYKHQYSSVMVSSSNHDTADHLCRPSTSSG